MDQLNPDHHDWEPVADDEYKCRRCGWSVHVDRSVHDFPPRSDMHRWTQIRDKNYSGTASKPMTCQESLLTQVMDS